jgi:intracellular proteinase inhibitor BsuPI
MKTRALITLLCAGAAGLVWSPRAHSEASYPALQTRGRAPRDTGDKERQGRAAKSAVSRGRRKMDGQLVPSLNVVRIGEQIRFNFNVANAGTRRVEVKFPSGQTHDIVVLDSAGRELWRRADGRMFTEARQYRTIGGGDSLLLQDGWENPSARGKLVAVAVLKSTNYPIEHRVEFTLP